MAYGDFTIEQLKDDFGIKFDAENLFPKIQQQEPSDWLKKTLQMMRVAGLRSEKSRSERIVSPILMEVAEYYQHRFTIYSGEQLNVDKAKGLNGECDFIFSWSLNRNNLTAPIFCLTEAEKNDIDKGLVQVYAQVLGAYFFNQKSDNQDIKVIYGCATNGFEWKFLKFENEVITTDSMLYSLAELPELLGILQFIVESTKSK